MLKLESTQNPSTLKPTTGKKSDVCNRIITKIHKFCTKYLPIRPWPLLNVATMLPDTESLLLSSIQWSEAMQDIKVVEKVFQVIKAIKSWYYENKFLKNTVLNPVKKHIKINKNSIQLLKGHRVMVTR